MSAGDLLSYFLTVLTISVAPGPVVLMMMARSASRDGIGAAGFGLGSAIGGVVIVALACLGLATWLADRPEIFAYSKWAMMAYILWLARGIWRRDTGLSIADRPVPTGFPAAVAGGVFTCFLSPYYMILFPLLLPEVLDIARIEMPEFLIVSTITFAAFSTGALGVVLCGTQLARLVRNTTQMRRFNRGLAAVLVGGGGWMALG